MGENDSFLEERVEQGDVTSKRLDQPWYAVEGPWR